MLLKNSNQFQKPRYQIKYYAQNKLIRLLLSLGIGYLGFELISGLVSIRSARLWSSRFSIFSDVGLGFLILFYVLVFACVLLAIWAPQKLQFVKRVAISMRQRLGVWRLPVSFLVILVPVIFLLYTVPGSLFTGSYLRLQIGFPVCFLLAIFLTRSDTDLIKSSQAVLAVLFYSSVFLLSTPLTHVRNYPFSLTWSEGNRLYDYSVILGSQRYHYAGKLTIPYNTPGRFLLWGFLFAIPNTPIWLHRLWDAILSTVPYVLLGYLVARWTQSGRPGKISLALWIFLFLYQGPVYAPLIISAMIIVLTVNKKRLWLSLVGAAIAGSYASLSRWTWMPAPAIWAVLLLVSDFEWRPGDNSKRVFSQLAPMIIVALTGLVAGFLAKADFFSPEELSSTTTFEQPLLWYRLLPNATFSTGIMLALLTAVGPIMALMIWGGFTRWWRINWVQAIIYTAASLLTLVVGLVISVKIGGGGDLHNLDMFLITQVFLIGFIFKDRAEINRKTLPILVQALFFLAIILPAWNAISQGEPLQLPAAEQVSKGLDTIQREVKKAKLKGEVLFMDQRQLLTFGFVQGAPLVPDYEKKFVMDMAMGNNKEYFSAFYSDLAQQRFALIVTEPLKEVEKGRENSFGDENNAWVKWVSDPILCYYEPIKTWKLIKVQLLIPRPDAVYCPK